MNPDHSPRRHSQYRTTDRRTNIDAIVEGAGERPVWKNARPKRRRYASWAYRRSDPERIVYCPRLGRSVRQ
jgi:hypothetical protein